MAMEPNKMTSLMANPMPTIDTVCSADQLIEAPSAPSPAGTANIPMLVIMKQPAPPSLSEYQPTLLDLSLVDST